MNGRTHFTKLLTALLLGLAMLAPAQAVERVIHYHNDALGSPIVATDQEGRVVWRKSYAPYGQPIGPEARNEPGYTGKFEEPDLGIQNFGARWYDPRIGRFLAIDPVGFDPQNPQSFNRYAYANNNPYRYVDPNGESPFDVGFFIADTVSFGLSLYSGNPEAIATAGVALAASALGLASPIPGTGLAIKAARAADKVEDAARVASGGTIPSNKSLSTIRVAGGNETFVRFESADVRFSKVTPEGGLKPRTFAAPSSELPVPLSERARRFNLPDPEIPRTRQLDIHAPGDMVTGPRPISGGTGNEVQFPFGTRPGSVR